MSKIFNFGFDFKGMKFVDILRNFFLFFVVFAFCGWIYEEIVFIVEEHMLVNRGVLFGPWLPVYGVGGFLIVMLFYRYKDKKIKIGNINIRPLVILIEASLLAVIVELITTYIIDFTGGNFKDLWDYSGNILNYQGRIALIPGLKFGVIALFGIYFVQPLLNKFIKEDRVVVDSTTLVLFIFFMIDVISRIWLGNNYIR